VKETPEDFKPRRDGWFEHTALWSEVTVGTVLAQRDTRTQAWEVIATSHGIEPIPFNSTLWLRLRNTKTGQEITLPPRNKTGTCVVLTRDPLDTETAPPTDPVDVDTVLLVVESLGATLLATKDEETGVVYCPDYVWTGHIDDEAPQPLTRGLIEHLAFAHNIVAPEGTDYTAALIKHGEQHRATGNSAAFAHVHLPEEDTVTDFVRNRRIKDIFAPRSPA